MRPAEEGAMPVVELVHVSMRRGRPAEMRSDERLNLHFEKAAKGRDVLGGGPALAEEESPDHTTKRA